MTDRSDTTDRDDPVIHWDSPSEHEWLHYDPDFHGYLTPSGAFARRPKVTLGLFVVLVVVAFIASIDQGAIFDTWDIPIQEWVEDHRTGATETFFRGVSRLGSNIVIFPVAAVLALIAWFRCRPLAAAIVGAVALRPLFEFALKDVVGRPRPDLDRLVNGVGFSHPSGHVLATVTLYSLVPAVVALYVGRHKLWRATWAVVSLLPILMAMCRVFLGVHWATDVVAGLLWGVVYLAGVGMVFDRYHIGQCGHHSEHWHDEHAEHPHHLRSLTRNR